MGAIDEAENVRCVTALFWRQKKTLSRGIQAHIEIHPQRYVAGEGICRRILGERRRQPIRQSARIQGYLQQVKIVK